jgi:heat shock protein HslJ
MCFYANKEPQYFAALSEPNMVISLENGLLTFRQDKTIVLQFEKGMEDPSQAVTITAEALAGKWNLTSIAGGDMAALFVTNQPTMEIGADGMMAGNAGCNNYRLPYALEGDVVTFGPAMITKMACPSLEGEQLFASMLNGPMQAILDGNKLAFLKDGIVALEFTKAE